ncbi:MAG: MotA/TolQ/ExbB proton channel family protein [Candidatus Omnitrophica bacterium]|nr:MotA/TolQ/ExbB proton channel family protein [Candidatus Omnitrophota bacterium]MCM8802186.1 MotA/TolQ/ExbB proton channel family protein [Candidatus Omnitrophota bacterium]
MNLWLIVVKGGYIMIPIFICGVLTLAIIIERFIYLKNSQIDSERFISEIENLIKKRKIREAIEKCEKYNKPVPNIIKAGLLKLDRTRDEIKETIEDSANHQIPELEKYLVILATIAVISPLLGLLGTVTGMIKAFMVIEMKEGLVHPGELARGIWEALITTVGGLVVAIPAYLSYNYFVSYINNLILEMEKSATRLIDLIFLIKSEEE